MNILISAVAIKKTGGATRHLKNLIFSIRNIDKDNKYYLCVNKEFPGEMNYGNISILTFDIKSNLHRFYWDQFKIRDVIKKYNIDVLVSLLNFGCINSPIKQINFQRGPTYFCEYYLSALSFGEKIIAVLRRKLLYLTMKSSIIVITPSKSMRNMIRRFYPYIPENKFRTIPHGFDKDRFLAYNNELPLEVKEIFEKIPSDITKILYVSHLMSYKGHDILIKAMKRLKDYGIKFRLIVTMERLDWPEGFDEYISMIDQFKLNNYITVLNRIPEDSVANLYRQCDVFVFPSLCESFGFPMVEAMSIGLPIVAAATPVNMEICGSAALYYEPLDPEDAARKIGDLIGNVDLRKELRHNASTQIADSHISWDEYVKRCLYIFEEAMNE